MTPEDCAHQVLDVVPLIMRLIRAEMRRHCGNHLSIPQFRTLAYLYRNPGALLSEVADHLGVTPPTMSRIAGRLAERGLILREGHPDSRRCLTLTVTDEGKGVYEVARSRTRERIASRFEALPPDDLALIAEAMSSLNQILNRDALRGGR